MEILRSRRLLAVVAGMKKTNDHAEPTKLLLDLNRYSSLVTQFVLPVDTSKKVKTVFNKIKTKYLKRSV